jgi:tetratricopeptide (TPR) repeat protein
MVIFATSCKSISDKKLTQEKGKSQTEVLQLLQQIDSLGNVGEFSPQVTQDFIAKAEEFSNKYPEDAMSPEFLFKAGLMAMTVAKATENIEEKLLYCQTALTFFDNIERVYPDFYGIKNCIFNKGVIYDDILHDYENAEIYYRMFIARYPTDSLSITLESYLQYLGKSPEEIVAEFRKK